jgi:N-acetylglucosaminyldiphosphoundecaprenol N-acetyl-beta-D-mannosaminyltransferase
MSGGTSPRRYPVLGLRVDAVDPPTVVQTVRAWIAGGARTYVCVANVHVVMEARRDEAFARVLDEADLTVPDGMPLVWVGRALGENVSRVYGPDLTLELCAMAAREGRTVAFYGGAPGVAAELGAVMERRFPGLRVVAALCPPFRPLTSAEAEAEIATLNTARPDIVFVGLGCPKQELWMAANRARLEAPVLVGVGAAFDFHTGRVAQAPRWMMRVGLEWAFRLFQEPRRLWRRYVFNNPMFLLLAARQLIGSRRRGGGRQAT